MSTVLFIKGADFSANALGTIYVFAENGSAQDGEITISSSSAQSRFWFPFSPTQGRKYKAELHITNGSADPNDSSDLGAVRFVAGNTDRTGQDLIIVSTYMVQNYEDYQLEGEATCGGTYGYIYLNIQWEKDLPTKYPNFELKLYDITEE